MKKFFRVRVVFAFVFVLSTSDTVIAVNLEEKLEIASMETEVKTVIEAFTHHAFDEGTLTIDTNYDAVDPNADELLIFLKARNETIRLRYESSKDCKRTFQSSAYTYHDLRIEGDCAYADYDRLQETLEVDSMGEHETGHIGNYQVSLIKMASGWKVTKAYSESPWNDHYLPVEYRTLEKCISDIRTCHYNC